MLENSLIESGGQLKTRASRWMFVTGVLNLSILAILILIPLMYPDALPRMALTALLVAPPPPPPPPPPPSQKVVPVKIVSEIDSGLHAPARIPNVIKLINEEAAPSTDDGVVGMQTMDNGNSTVARSLFSNLVTNTVVVPRVVPKAPTAPVMLPSRAATALIISQPDPVYPVIAKAAHVQGAVILHAFISKEGTIENLSVVSGNGMLVNAARDAVQRWRYKPYLLNGEPVEVETSITVNFVIGAA
jgi:protein TonB